MDDEGPNLFSAIIGIALLWWLIGPIIGSIWAIFSGGY